MTEGDDLLVGDAERAEAASELRDHYEAGRLTLEELESRLESVHAARTVSDLREAFRQLPARVLPTFSPRDTRWRSLALQYALLNVVAILVWVFSGGQGDFWPRWVFVATLAMFVRRAFGPRRRGHPRPLPPPSDEAPGEAGRSATGGPW